MRKQLTILSVLLFLLTSAVHGQVTQANTQFPNPGFEKWSDHGCSTAQGTSEVPDNWHTFDEVKYDVSIGGSIAKKTSHYKLTGSDAHGGSGNALQLASHSVTLFIGYSILANGTITSGRTRVGDTDVDSYKNYNFSQLTVNTSNDYYPSYGNHKWYWDFIGCPDSMSFYYKTNWTTASNKPLIKVYLHKGDWYDHASGVVNTTSNGQSNELSSPNLIAYCQTSFSPSTSWKRFVSKFTQYGNNSANNDNDYSTITRPQYILASFSTNETAGGGTSSDKLTIDDLWCIYDKGLSSLSIGGTANSAILNALNAAEFATHEPSRTYDNQGNPIFNNSGSYTYEYNEQVCYDANGIFPEVQATPRSKLISNIVITQATPSNPNATITVTHNDNSTFTYTIHFANAALSPTVTLNSESGAYSVCQNGTVTITASGDAISYTWSNGLGNSNTANPPTGTVGTTIYTITGYSSNGCATTATATVTVNPLPTITLSNNNSQTVCSGTPISNINVTYSGGSATATGLPGVSFNANTGIISGTPNGTSEYTITVTSIYTPSCGTASASGSITVLPQPVATLTMSSITACEGTAITPITATTSGGNVTTSLPAGLTFNNETGKITGVPTAAGTITITTTSNNCGTATATCTVSLTPSPSVTLSENKNQTLCSGNDFTAITVSYSGGTATVSGLNGTGLSYNNGQITGTPNTGTHTYYITVNSSTCGSVSDTGTIIVNPNPTVTLSPSSLSVCQNAPVEGLSVSPFNNTTQVNGLPAGLSFNNTTGQITGVPTVAGTFPISVSTSTNCGQAETTGSITVKPLPSASLSNPNIEVCEGENISPITVNATNAANSSTVNLSNGLQFSGLNNNTGTITGIPTTAGTFTVTVNSNNQCGNATAEGTVTIKNKPNVSINSPETLCQGVTETITAEGNFVSCLWDDNSTDAVRDITPNHAGLFTYSVTVTGSNSCTNNAATTVTVQSSPTIPNATTVSNSSCHAPYNGSITVTSPTGNYTYSINGTDFQESTLFSNLSAGTYILTVKNAAGCTSTKEITVGSTGSNVTAQVQANNPCVGDDLTLTGSSSSSNVSFAWTGPNGFISENPSPTISNATTNNNGTYTLTVTEAATGCTSSASVTVTVKLLPTVNIAQTAINPSVCPGTALNILVDGQNGTLSSSGLPEGVRLTNGFITGTVSTPGIYNYSISNTSECGTASVNGIITVYDLPVITFTGTPSFCQGYSTTIGVQEAYNNYIWNINGNNNNSSITVYTTNTYSVTVTDENGCQNSSSIDVTMNDSPEDPIVTITDNTNCTPFNGIITVTAPLGNSYLYSIDGVDFQESPVFGGLESDEYTITVIDGNGCQSMLDGIFVDDFAEPFETEITVDNVASYEWNGTTLTESGDYTETFTATNGCDSIVTLHLTTLGQTTMTQTIALASGTNWVSFYVETNLNDLKAALVATGNTTITIQGQTQNATYNPSNGRWTGQLRALDLSQMYMIKLTEPCEITLEGMLVDPSMHPVTIAPGANYIAYPFNTRMTVTNAFAGFGVANDQVQSQLQNANYSGTRWTGQLRNLEPGKGYIYKSASTETRTFTFPLGN